MKKWHYYLKISIIILVCLPLGTLGDDARWSIIDWNASQFEWWPFYSGPDNQLPSVFNQNHDGWSVIGFPFFAVKHKLPQPDESYIIEAANRLSKRDLPSDTGWGIGVIPDLFFSYANEAQNPGVLPIPRQSTPSCILFWSLANQYWGSDNTVRIWQLEVVPFFFHFARQQDQVWPDIPETHIIHMRYCLNIMSKNAGAFDTNPQDVRRQLIQLFQLPAVISETDLIQELGARLGIYNYSDNEQKINAISHHYLAEAARSQLITLLNESGEIPTNSSDLALAEALARLSQSHAVFRDATHYSFFINDMISYTKVNQKIEYQFFPFRYENDRADSALTVLGGFLGICKTSNGYGYRLFYIPMNWKDAGNTILILETGDAQHRFSSGTKIHSTD